MTITVITLVLISFFSVSGIVFMFLNRLAKVKTMEGDELTDNLVSSKSIFSSLRRRFISPISNFWHTVVLPGIYKETEKTISRFRLNILKAERALLRLTNYIRGKREIKNNGDNGSSPYWQDINEFKNGLNDDNDSQTPA